MTWAVRLLGTISVASLAVVTVLLWRLLRDLPTRRRLANLCLPLSQILCVVHAMALSGEYVYGAASAVLSSVLGIACAICDPLLYRSLLQAERAHLERERAEFLESQVRLQERHLAEAREARREASAVRERLDDELSRLERALRTGSAEEVRECLAGAERAVESPGEHACEHQAADALIASKLRRAREAGVMTKVRADIPSDLATPTVELCAVLANALDNAIDACEELPEKDRWIELSARPTRGFFSLEIANSCAPKRREEDGADDVTGILREHGWGRSIIESIARRHEGDVQEEERDGAHRLSVIWALDD